MLEKKLGELIESVSEKYDVKKDKVILINTSDVLEGRIINHKYVENKNLKGQFKKSFRKNDILYSEIRPQNKRFAYVDIESDDYVASTKLMVLRTKNNDVYSEYIFQFLKTPKVIEELQSLAETRSGTFPQITFNEIANLKINLPEKTQQKKVVNILKSIDKKIEINNKINHNLDKQMKELFKNTFINNYKGNTNKKSLYEFAEFINGTSFKANEYSESGIPIIKISELKNGITDNTQYYNGKKEKKYYIKDKQILFSWSGNPDTSIDIFIWCGGDAILNQHTFKIITKDGNSAFIYLLLKYFKPIFMKIARNKQTTGLGHVTVTDLKRIMFPYDKEVIEKFNLLITPFYNNYFKNMLENNKLKKIRDILLPKLMNGEIDVSNISLEE